MTLQWNHHDAGYIYASGGKGRYEISEVFGLYRGMFRLYVRGKTAFFTSLDDAKMFAQEME